MCSLYDIARDRGGAGFGLATIELDGSFGFSTSAFPVGFFNRAVGLGTARPAREHDVEALTAFFAGNDVPQSVIQVVPEVETPEVAGWLEAHGHRGGRTWVKLFHDLQALPSFETDVVFERIGAERAAEWRDIVLSAFEMPEPLGPLAAASIGAEGWTHYLGLLDGRPVHAAAMHVAGDTAWIGFGATLEDARGHGAQRGSFALRLSDAKAAGCTLAVTETGAETEEEPVNHSLRNMISSGFVLAYHRRNWVRGG